MSTPDASGMRRVPAEQVSLQIEHVEDCGCRYTQTPGQRMLDDEVKLIDARCIAAYLIPRRW